MMKHAVKGIICIVVLGVLSASPVLALDVYLNTGPDNDLSDKAFARAVTNLGLLKAEFTALIAQLTPAEKVFVDDIIAKIDDKADRLENGSIKVYLFPGDPETKYNELYQFYVTDGRLSSVQDVDRGEIENMADSLSLPSSVSAQYKQLAASVEAKFDAVPDQYETLRAQLKDFVDTPTNVVKAFTGNAGKARASVMTFYVNEDPVGTFTVNPTTTLVIATDE